MEYKIVQEENPTALVLEVNKEIFEGWKPMSGIAVIQDDPPLGGFYRRHTFFQAMTRETEKAETTP